MEFKALSLEDCEKARTWRNDTMNALRTPYQLIREQQEDFYYNTVCDRKANVRYWGIWQDANYYACGEEHKGAKLIGMAGIENIEWENRRGEISLILDPKERSKALGDDAVNILLDKGFNELNLEGIWGICYWCNPAIEFWKRQINRYKAETAELPAMKYYKGRYYNGLYFHFERSNYVTDNT